ncbi:MAG: PorV/PorQ family protein [Marinifilaceae bacterium]
MRTLIILLLCVVFTPIVHGQTVPIVTINPDAANWAMGNSGVLTPESAFHVYGNVTRTLLSDHRGSAGVSWMPWMPNLMSGMGIYSAAGNFRVASKHGVAFGYRGFYMPQFPITNMDGVVLRQEKPRDFTIDAGYCYAITPRLIIGLNAHFISSKIAEYAAMSRANAFAIDIDLLFHASNWTVGLAMKNWGTQLRYSNVNSDLPSALQLSATRNYVFCRKHMLKGNVGIQYRVQPQQFSGIEGGAGLEYSYKELLFFRGGYHFGQEDKTSPCYGTLGAGINIKMIQLDAGYIIAKNSNPMHKSYCFSMTLLW